MNRRGERVYWFTTVANNMQWIACSAPVCQIVVFLCMLNLSVFDTIDSTRGGASSCKTHHIGNSERFLLFLLLLFYICCTSTFVVNQYIITEQTKTFYIHSTTFPLCLPWTFLESFLPSMLCSVWSSSPTSSLSFACPDYHSSQSIILIYQSDCFQLQYFCSIWKKMPVNQKVIILIVFPYRKSSNLTLHTFQTSERLLIAVTD